MSPALIFIGIAVSHSSPRRSCFGYTRQLYVHTNRSAAQHVIISRNSVHLRLVTFHISKNGNNPNTACIEQADQPPRPSLMFQCIIYVSYTTFAWVEMQNVTSRVRIRRSFIPKYLYAHFYLFLVYHRLEYHNGTTIGVPTFSGTVMMRMYEDKKLRRYTTMSSSVSWHEQWSFAQRKIPSCDTEDEGY